MKNDNKRGTNYNTFTNFIVDFIDRLKVLEMLMKKKMQRSGLRLYNGKCKNMKCNNQSNVLIVSIFKMIKKRLSFRNAEILELI